MEYKRGRVSVTAFPFLELGVLRDGEGLELVAPGEEWVDEVMYSAAHPLTVAMEPMEMGATRRRLADFLRVAPGGKQEGDARRGRAPAYHFWMRAAVEEGLPLRMVGGISFRVGGGYELEMYSGNIGYHVYPPARGRHFAERACRLILPLARGHGMKVLWITCNPENVASRKTCERLGATLVEIVNIPKNHEFYGRGERQKCRYRWVIEE